MPSSAATTSRIAGSISRRISAKLWDVPASPPPVAIAASGAQSCRLAALAGRRPHRCRARRRTREPVHRRRRSRQKDRSDNSLSASTKIGIVPSSGPTTCSDGSTCGWKVNAELPGTDAFAAAAGMYVPKTLREAIPCGSDADEVVKAAGTNSPRPASPTWRLCRSVAKTRSVRHGGRRLLPALRS